ncbi:MAG: hypothetical protein IJW99_01780 [Clostridia bacterium]|nr:hypothetical protein [Clostridia bacterium]
MKKYVKTVTAMLAVLMLMTSMFACGSGEAEVTHETQRVEEWSLNVNGKELYVGMDMPKDLGEPTSYFEAASCAIQGLDKDYTYGSILVKTEDDGKTERIVGLTILDDGAATTMGVTIGDSRDKVVGAHSTPKSESETALVYAAGVGVIAKFLLRDGVVTSITYTLGE